MCALLSEQGAGVALRIAPCRRSSALTAVGAWEVRIVVELGVLRMYAISDHLYINKKYIADFFSAVVRFYCCLGLRFSVCVLVHAL